MIRPRERHLGLCSGPSVVHRVGCCDRHVHRFDLSLGRRNLRVVPGGGTGGGVADGADAGTGAVAAVLDTLPHPCCRRA